MTPPHPIVVTQRIVADGRREDVVSIARTGKPPPTPVKWLEVDEEAEAGPSTLRMILKL